LFAIHDGSSSILIDTRMQMQAFEEAAGKSLLRWLSGCKLLSRNVRLGSSLIDYLFACNGKERYVEVKSAALRDDSHYAMYPDCPTLRGRRHIHELTNLASKGGLATIVFVAALSDIEAFKPNRSGDSEIPPLLQKAQETGVTVKAIGIHYDPETCKVYLDDPDLKVDLRNS
jgi:sugar fermentation stimulation protein A